MRRISAAAAIAAALSAAAPALAQDAWWSPKSDGDWMVRVRALWVGPNESLSARGIPGADASISNEVVPELDITYFFTPNIAAELILATAQHDVSGRGALGGNDIGSVWLLPPTLTLQYHFTGLDQVFGHPHAARIKPYVGAGVNYTIFYDVDAGDLGRVDYDDTFGWALQAGVDIEIGEGWYLNADVKYIGLSTDWSIPGVASGDVDIDPLLVGVGLGYRF